MPGLKFGRAIEYSRPDPDVPGWNVLRLVCGHTTHQPAVNTNDVCHCGDCQLDHYAHLAKIAEIDRKYLATCEELNQKAAREAATNG